MNNKSDPQDPMITIRVRYLSKSTIPTDFPPSLIPIMIMIIIIIIIIRS